MVNGRVKLARKGRGLRLSWVPLLVGMSLLASVSWSPAASAQDEPAGIHPELPTGGLAEGGPAPGTDTHSGTVETPTDNVPTLPTLPGPTPPQPGSQSLGSTVFSSADWPFHTADEPIERHPDYEWILRNGDRIPGGSRGPCPNGQTGDAQMPPVGTAYGAIFSPATDSFVGTGPAGSSRPVHREGSGTPAGTGVDPAPEFASGHNGETLRVQAHFWADPVNGPQFSMVRVRMASLTTSSAHTYPFWTFAGGFHPQFNCYADDESSGSNAFYFDWEVPLADGIVAEPGFSVKVEVLSFDGTVLHDSDVNTVHVGPPPTGTGEMVESAAGVALDEGVIVDTNGAPDDLESVLRSRFLPILDDMFEGLEEVDISLTDQFGVPKGAFAIKEASGDLSVDLWLEPTTTGSATVDPDPVFVLLHPLFGAPLPVVVPLPPFVEPSGPDDDEYRLHARATLDDALFKGIVSYSPFGADWELGMDIDLELSVAIDTTANRLAPTADLRLEDIDIDVTHEHIDIWQWFYDLLVNEETLTEDLIVPVLESHSGPIAQMLLSGGPGGTLAGSVDGVLSRTFTNIDDVLGGGVTVGNGGFGLLAPELQDTCDPLGCDGFGAGQVMLWQEGLDVLVDTGVTNLGTDRFTGVYDPDTGDVGEAVHDRATDSGGHFDVGVILDAALLNQELDALASAGLLDLGLTLDGGIQVTTTPEVAPAFIPTEQLGLAGPESAPLMLLLPNLQVDVGGARFAVDVAAGVDASVDPGTGELIPEVDVALNVNLLQCPGLELVCGLINNDALLDAFEAAVVSLLVDPLVENSLGRITVPAVLELQLGSAHVAQLDGNVAVFADIVPTPRVDVDIVGDFTTPGAGNPTIQLDSVEVSALPEFLPGSGPYTVHWTIRDAANTVIYSSPPGGEPNLSIQLDADELNPQDFGGELYAEVGASVTVSRGGVSVSDSDRERFWWLDPDVLCPPVC